MKRGAEPPAARRFGSAARIATGCILVVVLAAVVGGVLAQGQVSNVVSALSQNKSLTIGNGALAPAGWGQPQTLLLVGNDQRAHTTTNPVLPHSNEMLLVRFDPGKPFISMMSLPRELQVPIDTAAGVVDTRFNAAFTYGSLNGGGIGGGISLMVKTIKQVTGLAVNHVVVIDFGQFEQAVDAMGCVYSTVDRPYYHLNVPGGEQYFQVNLQPGYQQMCGAHALQFVAYRHGDLSTIRDARDQDFLLGVKQEFGQNLIGNVGKFESIFGKLVQTDASLHTSSGLLDLLGTLISSAGDSVRQVQFKVTLGAGNNCGCSNATPQQIASSVHSFLHGAVSVPKRSTARAAKRLARHKLSAALALAPVPGSEVAQARLLAAHAHLGFPLEYPRLRALNAAGTPIDLHACVAVNNDDTYPLSCMRRYTIHGPGGISHPAYVIVTSNGMLGQYYDIQGTSWTSAPLFDSPTQSVRVRGRTYALYYQGAHLETVAWFEHGAAYWVHNTLLDSISNTEMLALSEHVLPVSGTASDPNPGGSAAGLPATVVPLSSASSGASSVEQRIGLIGGLLALLSMPLLLWLAVRRVRHNAGLRERLHELAIRESALVVRAGSAGLPVSALGASGIAAGLSVVGLSEVGSSEGRWPEGGWPEGRWPDGRLPEGRSGRRSRGWSGGWAEGAGEAPDVNVYGTSRTRSGGLSGGPRSSRRFGWLGWLGQFGRTRRFRRFGRGRLAGRAAVALVVIGLVVGAGVLGSSALSGRSVKAVAHPRPTVPVEVLNATPANGVAAQLAARLRSHGVKVAGVGNLVAKLQHREYVLYARGAKVQAKRLTYLLGSHTARPQPITAAQAAVIGRVKLAVVIG